MNNKIYNMLELKLESEGKSSGTLKEYFASIRKLEKFFKGKFLESLTEKDLRQYALYLKEKGYSKTTYNSRIAAVRYLFIKVLKRDINLNDIPLERIRDLKEKN